MDEARKLPPGLARGEDFLRRLKAIDTSYLPPEMKQALSDYIEADERGLIAIEAGRDPLGTKSDGGSRKGFSQSKTNTDEA